MNIINIVFFELSALTSPLAIESEDRQNRAWCLSLELPVFLDEITILQWHGTESMEKAERYFQVF